MKFRIILLFCFMAFSAISKGQEKSEDFLQLIEWMTGEFSSSEQAQNDSSYYAISLKMVPIWPEKGKGAWLYVEQAVESSPDKPYRQRVYFVNELSDGEYSSDVYLIPNEENYIGAWKTPEVFAEITQFDLTYKDGCAVFLEYDGFQYAGKTNTGTCKSELRGASYATSEVNITKKKLTSWDRGYDADNTQVWGAEKGAYVFKKSD